MEPLVLIGLAIGLSMDALAVSIAEGAFLKEIRVKGVLRMALAFGGFQGLMPVVGWATGRTFSQYVMNVDHWIALVILSFIGGKMIWEELQSREEEKFRSCERMPVLLFMALATSIDALAVGFTFAFLNINILLPVLVIGGLTFVISGLGVYFGAWIGKKFERYVGIIGGSVLLFIGLKILYDHLVDGK